MDRNKRTLGQIPAQLPPNFGRASSSIMQDLCAAHAVTHEEDRDSCLIVLELSLDYRGYVFENGGSRTG